MPIKIPNDLPATRVLTEENIFVMTEKRAIKQDIRPLRIALLNLMPTKIETETQISRLLGNSPLQVELTLVKVSSHTAKNTSADHLIAFYKTFSQIKEEFFDGMVVTGAPVEHLPFEQVDYWQELCEIFEWSKTHVHSTFHICWGAQAGLYYHYGIPKVGLDGKLFGVYPHTADYKRSILLRGFDDTFWIPHSRHSSIKTEDVKAVKDLKILASSEQAGTVLVSAKGGRQIFMTGHAEYDPNTLQKEYERDVKQGLPIAPPENYFPDDDPSKPPMVRWRSTATMLYANWLNYYVYQATPFDVMSIGKAEPTENSID